MEFADPNFNIAAKVDMLLDIDIFFEALLGEKVVLDHWGSIKYLARNWTKSVVLFCTKPNQKITRAYEKKQKIHHR
jgi:hypothetical protein